MVRDTNSVRTVEGEHAPRTLEEAVLAAVRAYYDRADRAELFVPAPDDEFVAERFFDFSFLEGADAIEHYWVHEPFAFVSIVHDRAANERIYHVSEPVLDPFEGYVREDLTKILRNSLLYRDLDRSGDRRTTFEREAIAAMAEHAGFVEAGSLHKLRYYLIRDFVDFGRIDPIMRDAGIEDVSCDGDGVPVFVYHGTYRDLRTNVRFGASELTSFTVQLAQRAGKQVSVSEPLVDASLSDGSRVQLTLGTDVSTRGSNFTIRKFSEEPFTPVDLVRWNTFGVEQMAYFWLAIENNRSLVFAGGTGSGKTTSLNAVSFFVPQNSKVVSIEDTREVTLPHDNWIQSVTRDSFAADGRGAVSMYDLLQAALRQRPEYLLVGEIRTEERVALTFFHAIATGHTAYTTVHADSVEGVLNRMTNEPLNVPASMVGDLDVVSIQKQIHLDGDRVRRNVEVAELVDDETGGRVDAHTVFERDPRTDAHVQVGESRVLAEIAAERGWDDAELARQLETRERVVRHLLEAGVSDFREVGAVIHAFGKDPEAVLADIETATDPVAVDTDGAARDGADGDDADADGADADDLGDEADESVAASGLGALFADDWTAATDAAETDGGADTVDAFDMSTGRTGADAAPPADADRATGAEDRP